MGTCRKGEKCAYTPLSFCWWLKCLSPPLCLNFIYIVKTSVKTWRASGALPYRVDQEIYCMKPGGFYVVLYGAHLFSDGKKRENEYCIRMMEPPWLNHSINQSWAFATNKQKGWKNLRLPPPPILLVVPFRDFIMSFEFNRRAVSI